MSLEQEMLTSVQKGDLARVKELLQTKPGLAGAANADGPSAVLLACYHRQKAIIETLLATGIELNVFEASATGQGERVAALLERDPGLANAFACDGFTPLGLAAFFGHGSVAEMLLRHGARVNLAARNSMQVMPLHSAAAGRDLAMVGLLLDHGAEVNARQQAGATPLHSAAASGKVDIAAVLIAHGADVNAKMDDGVTPRALAVKHNHAEMAEFLRTHGAS
ncbi:MAG TPA: ankyrin repeat domain-containing protein [Gemmataceae bacterium]|jgi:ankyrin repeat protein|nr:ankyrin repeat domain-containing protein [Gemmataceae bacterium]